jgi:hypothetical protein
MPSHHSPPPPPRHLIWAFQYMDFANQIIAVSQMNAIQIFAIYTSMSLQMTAYTMGTGARWPNVIFPEFDRMIEQARNLTGAAFVGFCPLVKHEDRQDYEDFSYNNQAWVQAALERSNISADQGWYNISTPPFIVRQDMTTGASFRETKHDLYAPVIQISPLDTQGYLLNYNGFDYPFFRRVFDGMVEAKRAVLSEVNNMEAFVLPEEITDDVLAADTKAHPEIYWPVSFMASPVYNELGDDAELAGVIVAGMRWHSYFQNVIPEGINGIIVVVQNTCDQKFSYRIDGPEVTYLGPQDYHDPSHQDYEVEASFTAFTSIADCVYSFHVYPTEELIETYQTDRPVTFTIAIVLVFLEVTIVFWVYDALVERRQEKVMTSAMRSGAIVNR